MDLDPDFDDILDMLTLLRHIIDGSLNCEKTSSLNNKEKNH